MIVYHYHHETGDLLGSEAAFESPLEPGVYLIPAYATAEVPPATEGDDYPAFIEGVWQVCTPPVVSEPEAIEPTELELAQTRINEIDAALLAIDVAGARPSREIALALLAGAEVPEDAKTKLIALEAEAATLRSERATLPAQIDAASAATENTEEVAA